MEIDFGTAILGTILILVCIAPLVLIHYNRVKKEKKILKNINDNATKHNCKVTQYEFCGDFVLGLDETRNFVFFFKQRKAETISLFVDLSEIRNCQAIKTTRDVKKDSASNTIYQQIELRFIPKNKGITETSFELFDETENAQLSGELQFVEKWSKLINDRLKH
ncbi:MAG: hypothetical protein IPO21_07585 [Bacteroidales bacterium]|nr:hypothetical protein [Bacteroidales bacterium]